MSQTYYPIRAVARMTGIALDTIRAWERRYAAVTPERDARGRIYSQADVQRLILLRDAVARGHAIGQVAELADDKLKKMLQQTDDFVSPVSSGGRKVKAEESLLAHLLRAIEAFDYVRADRELNRLAAATADPRDLVYEIALPLMRITGERWHQGRFTIAQEHTATALLSGLLASMLRIYATPDPKKKVILATPENEHHGFGVLVAAMLTAASGMGAIHLGTNLPAGEVVQAVRQTKANAVVLGVCGAKAASVVPALQTIRKGVPAGTRLWLGGVGDDAIAKAAVDSRWTVLRDFQEFEQQLKALGAGN